MEGGLSSAGPKIEAEQFRRDQRVLSRIFRAGKRVQGQRETPAMK